jgi:hypothetical protein
MIIVDRLKSQYNLARPVECYFYRDNTGNEVDLIETEGHQVHAIEIKGGATISADYFKGLSRFKNTFPESFLDGTVIYGGDQSQPRTEWTVRSWRDVAAGNR